MGARSWIQVDSQAFDMPVLFYGHWSGDDNFQAVRNVLEKTTRVGDGTYLAAQIFYEFATVLGNYDGELSFGIGSGEMPTGDDYPTVYVNADTGQVRYDGVHYELGELTAEPIGHA